MPDEGIRKPSTSAKTARGANNKIRFVTAASLFDGHDASINIIRPVRAASSNGDAEPTIDDDRLR